MMWPSIALLTFVTLQRLGELVLARRNTAALRARGAREVAPEHYPMMVALHAAWIIGLWLLAPGRPVEPFWLAIFMGLQALRLWVLATLKDRWTTRIVILPGVPLVSSGPYRFLRHPNYVVVVGEIAILPLTFGLPVYATVFSLFNAAILHVRVKAENAALKSAMILK
ncbi:MULTISPECIES: isoprenylcysteine carboxyl methyltransferase family protein [unclassified Rhizobium]|uniref:isoprenylcysteine carboxyl methyltransferase family protein n=1 Tax=unclassified Rhizobium TaxID=2613769 RepID=UPI0007EB6A57|nr:MULTISPECIES: isoprenylcysteine carboxylmethyltransferase family protein [unclassified Rhizobium]ANK84419.1 isoprenylcysteine carboxyl methyltransferase protein [Rhizobium sp. N731]ANL14667.1 isoprenylcysteine carboxyl methyltransferase protein [Rhizobium sp. N1314]